MSAIPPDRRRARAPWTAASAVVFVLAFALALAAGAPPSATAGAPRVHALTNARIMTAPGQVIERGTVVFRDGVIEAVGANVKVPADARVWDAESLTVYPGLIDAFVLPQDAAPAGRPAGGPAVRPGQTDTGEPARGAASTLPAVRAEYRVIENLPLPQEQLESLRAAGFTVAQVAPRRGLVRGTSAVIGLGDGRPNGSALAADASQVVAIDAMPGGGYPGSLMGGIAVVRQAFLDAKWYRDANAAYARRPQGQQRPETNLSWAALEPAIAGRQPVTFVADDMLEVLRAAAIAKEAGVGARLVGAGDEYKRARAVAATGLPLVLPVAFPDVPDVADEANALEVSTEELRAWQEAPGNPAAMAREGVAFSLSTHRLRELKDFRANVARAIARGLDPKTALAAVTTEPAKLLGLGDRLGTLAPGRIANLTVTRGELFSEAGQVREVWIDGERHETAKDELDWAGTWDAGIPGFAAGRMTVGVGADTTVSIHTSSLPETLRATGVRLEKDRLRFRLNADHDAPRADLWRRFDRFDGVVIDAEGDSTAVVGWKQRPAKAARTPEAPLVPVPVVAGDTEPWRLAPPEQPAAVLVRNATIWTAGPQGTLAGADLLVRAGRIEAVGRGLKAPGGAVVIDGTGRHVAPGIIDEHSHAAILGNVNECTNVVTCEVRIGDVLNSESVNIYRQLAGGTTIMHLLHGSCNAIGGQCVAIKNRWGEAPDGLIMKEAPPTVKFALGENPKQANWGREATNRYPKSRAGVEQVIRESFQRARDYRAEFAEAGRDKGRVPPRRDLQLDALAEIVEGTRFIHCHSYRQDEILMLMRLTEEFGFRVNSFTHILEGYKVADEIATHGASAVGFSDWWAYKQEVIDAIPWNNWLLWDRGVNQGFNSDSEELARRLNAEAGKAIKYGGMPPDEAIRTVTLNPAKAMHIDRWVGSLEPGKQADFAIWSGPPMSALSRCEQTWIEGRRYFDRDADLAGRAALAAERAALIARAKGAKKEGGAPGGGRGARPPRYLEATDHSGNECGEHTEAGVTMPFVSEADRDAVSGGVQR